MAPIGKAVLAIGVFDGVHLGHRALIDRLKTSAQELGLPSVIVTFDPDPDELIRDDPAPRLLSHKERLRRLRQLGVDHVVIINFTQDFANLTPSEFLGFFESKTIEAEAIHVGDNFHFGKNGAGTIATLRAWGSEHGCSVYSHELLEIDSAVVSATRIRSAIESGHIEEANKLLGYLFTTHGCVIHGRGEGRGLGFPTANVTPSREIVCPEDGVYLGYVMLEDGRLFKAAVNIGTQPTFDSSRRAIEAHLIDFDEDLYGQCIKIQFIKRHRAVMTFSSLAELIQAIGEAVDEARRLP